MKWMILYNFNNLITLYVKSAENSSGENEPKQKHKEQMQIGTIAIPNTITITIAIAITGSMDSLSFKLNIFFLKFRQLYLRLLNLFQNSSFVKLFLIFPNPLLHFTNPTYQITKLIQYLILMFILIFSHLFRHTLLI